MGFGDTVLNVTSGAVTYGIGHGAHDVKIHHQNSKWKQTHTDDTIHTNDRNNIPQHTR